MTHKNSESKLYVHRKRNIFIAVTAEYQKQAKFASTKVKNTSDICSIHSPRFPGYNNTYKHFGLEIGIIIGRTANCRSRLGKMANLGYSQGSIRCGFKSAHKF